jgi:quercetin dioxygenase-like cupin family protein
MTSIRSASFPVLIDLAQARTVSGDMRRGLTGSSAARYFPRRRNSIPSRVERRHPVQKDDSSKRCFIPEPGRSRRMGKSISKRVLATAVVLALGAGAVIGESMPPRGNTGVTIGEPVVLDLAPWAGDMQGRQLRIRRFEIQPGGVIGLHSHDDRPDVSYLAQGNLVEYRAGGFAEPRASDSLHAAGKGVTHWVENKGSTPAVLVVADIFKPQ